MASERSGTPGLGEFCKDSQAPGEDWKPPAPKSQLLQLASEGWGRRAYSTFPDSWRSELPADVISMGKVESLSHQDGPERSGPQIALSILPGFGPKYPSALQINSGISGYPQAKEDSNGSWSFIQSCVSASFSKKVNSNRALDTLQVPQSHLRSQRDQFLILSDLFAYLFQFQRHNLGACIAKQLPRNCGALTFPSKLYQAIFGRYEM